MADISTLQQSLINAKKVMNKVDGGNFSTGNVGLSQPNITDSTGLISPSTPESIPQSVPSIDTGTARQDLSPKSNLTEDRIKKSKLPDAIKQAMIDNPIPDIPFNGGGAGLSEEFLSGVKNQMDKQGISTSIPSTQQLVTPTTPQTKKLSSKNLKSIIKESVKELIDEVVNSKINENIGVRTDMGENFQFRVGDKVFYGKITSSKTIK